MAKSSNRCWREEMGNEEITDEKIYHEETVIEAEMLTDDGVSNTAGCTL